MEAPHTYVGQVRTRHIRIIRKHHVTLTLLGTTVDRHPTTDKADER